MVNPEYVAAARALKPIHERAVFGRSVLLFDNVDRDQLAALGEMRRPSIADLFVAVMSTSGPELPWSPSRATAASETDQVGIAK
jgi:ABC-2 type transport system ATP-binding protein